MSHPLISAQQQAANEAAGVTEQQFLRMYPNGDAAVRGAEAFAREAREPGPKVITATDRQCMAAIGITEAQFRKYYPEYK